MLIAIPLNTMVAKVLKGMQEAQMNSRDKRTRLMSELLANIKSIKLYAWEFPFIRKILQVRNEEELKMLKKIGIVTVSIHSFTFLPFTHLIDESLVPEYGYVERHSM